MRQQRFNVLDVVPHSHRMLLIDEIIAYGEQFLTASVVIRDTSLFADAQGVPAWVGMEYMAQTIAAWSGVHALLRGVDVGLGYLVGTRKYHVTQPFFYFGEQLTVTAWQEFFADNLGVFACTIATDVTIATATINVYQPT